LGVAKEGGAEKGWIINVELGLCCGFDNSVVKQESFIQVNCLLTAVCFCWAKYVTVHTKTAHLVA